MLAQVAQRHIKRIHTLLKSGDTTINDTFDSFVKDLQDNLNPSVSRDDAVEMLAQHIITQPVFDALFDGYAFTKHNAVSVAMDKVVSVIQSTSLDADAATL